MRSGAVGHHFAGLGNPFWRLLHAAGLVPGPLTYADDVRLPAFGLGVTNIVERATRGADELTSAEFATGRRRLDATIARVRPRVVAFVGLSVYRHFFARRVSGGPGPKPERIHGARVFVVPNPSGRNAAFPGLADKLVWYRRLRRWAQTCAAPPGAGRRRKPARRATVAGASRVAPGQSRPSPAADGPPSPSGRARRKARRSTRA